MGRIKQILTLIKNVTIALLKGDLLLRLKVDRYLLHIIIFFAAATLSIYALLMFDMTMVRLEANKQEIKDLKIVLAQKSHDYESLDKMTKTMEMLGKQGSELEIPKGPAYIIEDRK